MGKTHVLTPEGWRDRNEGDFSFQLSFSASELCARPLSALTRPPTSAQTSQEGNEEKRSPLLPSAPTTPMQGAGGTHLIARRRGAV